MANDLEQFGGLSFRQSRIPKLDALEAFVPAGQEREFGTPDPKRPGPSRWFPVDGGHRVLFLYEGGEYDHSRFALLKGGWDHEHCNRCQRSIEPMTLCWVTEDGPYIILCGDCHADVFPGGSV